MQPTLLLLAAGMGSRYGGLKQLAAVGPSGQTMIDYAVDDAVRAGFAAVVFVIRKDFAEAFRATIGARHSARIEVRYAFQELDDLPSGHHLPTGRRKPWGTAHAVRAARHVIDGPFAVINADDFYGRAAYEAMAAHLGKLPAGDKLALSMVAYPLSQTLSPHGAVNRGICTLRGDELETVEEYRGIAQQPDGTIRGKGIDGEERLLAPDSLVSMNFWGFSPAIFAPLERGFTAFLEASETGPEAEYYLPSLVDELIRSRAAPCPVLTADSPWFGVTYPEDKARVVAEIAALTAQGYYDAG
jgi:NDP-sugar pyrophosphorylase family protein